ncbi:serine/threonine-protein kinase [Hyalangium rubrum]|uniref:Serine/threonine-protein kinase n=1 Tax=Hyalangium rubrum TaxID=3103134 RepID=A0ABU5HAY3_9BACT|nr:serine/threonine-protein kinase [Hyalangium sp. s54d21]MDY7230630.1 serine/threonine-protein kinase [Hyalangium sp. s54d21]
MSPAPDSNSTAPQDVRIGSWRVLRYVDRGSYGLVYRVEHTEGVPSGIHALKVAISPGDARFAREKALLSRIHHPNVPRLHDAGEWTDPHGRHFPYLVMQWVEGTPLYKWAPQGMLTSRQALRLLAQVARALQATHPHGVHRDVKGDNVRVSAEGHAVLLDFGACWYPGARPLTDTAIPPGTEPYRSPQLLRFRARFRGDPEDPYLSCPEDDIYALGVMAYRLVTERYPPPRPDPDCHDAPERPRPARPLAPSEWATVALVLDRLILRMLSDEPQARGTAEQLAQEMEEAAASAEPALDRPITLDPCQVKTERARRPGPPREWTPLLRPLLLVALLGIMGVLRLWRPAPYPQEFLPEPRQEPQESGRDGGSVGLGNTALASALPGGVDPIESRAVSLDMPDRPMKGQKRAPCDAREFVEINGGCWVRTNDHKPPCLKDWYEWRGSCYWPIMIRERLPTSEEP